MTNAETFELVTDAMVEVARALLAAEGADSQDGWHSWRCFDKVRYPEPCDCTVQAARSALEVVAPQVRAQIEAERPQVTLEWSPNDDSPPCVDFTCVCGYWRHLCNGPDWIEVGRGGSAPGVRCRECGVSWSLSRVSLMGRL